MAEVTRSGLSDFHNAPPNKRLQRTEISEPLIDNLAPAQLNPGGGTQRLALLDVVTKL